MYFEDIPLHTTIELAPATMDKETMLAFARAYDNVPLHTDEAYAKTTPFGGLIAPGMLSYLIVWAKYLEVDLFGEDLLAGKSTQIQWLKPVFAGDVLHATAQVTGLTRRTPRNGLVELTLTARNAQGDTVLTAVTEAIVKCRPAHQ